MTSYTGSEFALQKYVVDLLRFFGRPRVLWFAVPNGEYRSPRTGARLKAQGVIAGVADLVVVVNGRAHFLELKTSKGRQSAAQRDFETRSVDAGSLYMIARSPEAAKNILEIWRAIPVEASAIRAVAA